MSSSKDFSGKRILVTGAGRGIGKQIALSLCNAGAYVIALSRTESTLQTLKQEDNRIETAVCDVSDWSGTRDVVEGLGEIDMLVNNAAVMEWSNTIDTTEEDFDKHFNTNVKGVWNLSQIIAGNLMKAGKPGCIVNISSVCSHNCFPNVGLYSVTKAAVDHMTKIMAAEWGPKQIRVNAVCPGLINDTGMEQYSLDRNPNMKDVALMGVAMKKFADKEDIAKAVMFLLSDDARMMTGTIMDVAGGAYH